MEISIHKVKKITVDAPVKGSSSHLYFRTIKIVEEDGTELEVSLFADTFTKLLIKHEEE